MKVVLGFPIIGKPVLLLVNINYLQLQVVLPTRRCPIIQMDRWLPWLLDFHLITNCWLFFGYEYRQILPSHYNDPSKPKSWKVLETALSHLNTTAIGAGEGWRRLMRTTDDDLKKFRLSFSRCTDHDVASLNLFNVFFFGLLAQIL